MGATVDTKMTAIADEIRVLSGVEGKLGLDAMAENVSDANDKVSTQVSLISELTLALSGKAIDSGETVIRELNVVENGTYSAPVGVDGYSPVVVNVPAPALQSKKVYGIGSTETITADDGYDGLSDVTIYQTVNTPAMPVIGVSPELGQITATVTETGGYVEGTETCTKNLGTVGFGGVIITPTTEEQTIATVGKLVAGEIKVAGDVNLIPANIVSGVSIFGVAGTATSSGSGGDTDTEDAIIARTLTEYTNSRVTSVGACAFYSNTKITSVSFPNVKTIGNEAFRACSKLATIDFPVAETIGTHAFRGNTAMTEAILPNVTSLGGYAFRENTALAKVDFGQKVTIATYAFYGCTALTTLILRGATVSSLGSTYAMSNTPIVNGTGYIYVPSALVDSYKAATNWANYAAQFRAIEDYPEITGG